MQMNILEGKKVLFLSAGFFGYESHIKIGLEEMGAQVDFFNERLSDTIFSKGIIRVRKNWYQRVIDAYYNRIIESAKQKQYNFLFIIKGETVPVKFLNDFRSCNPKALMIFYAYDTLAEYPSTIQLLPLFDKTFTFEPADAVQYKMSFRPLFALSEYRLKPVPEKKKLDVVFIGTAHSDRYSVGEKVRKQFRELGLKTFFYYYSPSRIAFLLRRLFDPQMKHFAPSLLSFKKLSHAQIAQYYAETMAVLDINKPKQLGITIRTFEALAAGVKVITTNQDIVNYPFHDPQNILVINREFPVINQKFFSAGFKPLDEEASGKMTLHSWLHAIFVEDQHKYWVSRHSFFSAGGKQPKMPE